MLYIFYDKIKVNIGLMFFDNGNKMRVNNSFLKFFGFVDI